MKQVLPSLLFTFLAFNTFAQEDSIKTRHDKLYYPVASVETPVEILAPAATAKNKLPVVSTNAEAVQKPKLSRNRNSGAQKN